MMSPFERSRLLAVLLAAGLLLPLTDAAEAQIIHRERSLYSTILIDQQGSLICLQFSVRTDQRNQSCMDRKAPKKMVFPYAQMMMLSLLVVPEPQRILVVGLGGGTLPVALRELYPEANIDVIEIDPAVKTVAETYFGFAEDATMRVILRDARVFTKRAAGEDTRYDLIMLDAFNGDYIPEHLMTREYLQETKDLLAPGGVLAANTFAISRLYDHESTTYQAVFGTFYNIRSRISANRVIIAVNGELPDRAALSAAAGELSRRLRPFDVRINDYLREFSTQPDWDTTARVLTDQYAPANLLSNQ
ncbi:MAG TPA: fused MFS/spermidine synthase [Pseudomonadales bacterium]